MRDGPQMVVKGASAFPAKCLAMPPTIAASPSRGHLRTLDNRAPWKTHALDTRGTGYRATIQTNKKPLETTVKVITY